MTECEQFTLDPLVSPGAVLRCETLGQRGALSADRCPACARRVSPLPGPQIPVPAQESARGDQARYWRSVGAAAG